MMDMTPMMMTMVTSTLTPMIVPYLMMIILMMNLLVTWAIMSPLQGAKVLGISHMLASHHDQTQQACLLGRNLVCCICGQFVEAGLKKRTRLGGGMLWLLFLGKMWMEA